MDEPANFNIKKINRTAEDVTKRTRSKTSKSSSSRSLARKHGRYTKTSKSCRDKNNVDLQLQQCDSDDEAEAECVPNGFKMIQCFICGDNMNRIYKLREHMQLHADVRNCDESTLERSPIYGILNPHQRNIETSIICNFVSGEVREKRYSQFYGILTEAGIELHISDSETDSDMEKNEIIARNMYECDLCKQSFDRRYKALFHQKTAHTEHDMHIECDLCGRRYVSIQLLMHHLKTQCESDEHPITCVERFRQYLLKVNLEQFEGLAQARKDLKMHRLKTAQKLYACNICEKTFLRSEHLTRHKAVHMPDELKMECPVCFKKFNRKDNLRTHMKVHIEEAERDTNNDQFILCQYCGHCFTSKSNYVVHMRRRHTGEKPYTCDVCGKGFPKSTDLNSHKITHSGERKFSCHICNKSFGRSAVLTKHMRVHMGPYHCIYCDQSFQRPNELANHLRQHAGGSAQQGKVCNKAVSTQEQLDASRLAITHHEFSNVSNDCITTKLNVLPATEVVIPHCSANDNVFLLSNPVTAMPNMFLQEATSTSYLQIAPPDQLQLQTDNLYANTLLSDQSF